MLGPPGVERPDLPYGEAALEPHISKETVAFHFGKHHMGYYDKLQVGVAGTELERLSLDDIVHTAEGAVFNNAAQLWNHNFYWRSMSPSGGGEPRGELADAICESFGSFEGFKAEFSAAAAGHFGSGWAWLVRGKSDSGVSPLRIITTHDADTPLRHGYVPLLVCDVWEHAYYIDFRNDRASYIAAWWKLVDWEFAATNLNDTPPLKRQRT